MPDLDDMYLELSHCELFGQTVVGLLIEPLRLGRLGPRHDVIPFPQPLPAMEVGRAQLMQPSDELDTQLAQQRQPP